MASIANKPSLATVATSGAYSDLSWTPNLATVATSGSYNDLSNKPTIPTVNNATLTITQNWTSAGTFTANASSNKTIALTDTTYESKTAASWWTAVSLVTTWEKYTWNNKQSAISDLSTIRTWAGKGATAVQPWDLATVATSGSYNDLSNKPTIPTVNNSKITFTQNWTSKGDITLNQSSNETIALTDTTYSNITKSEIQTWTATTQRTVSASVINSVIPTISGQDNNILWYAKIRAGNKSDYDAMNSHDANTLYFCIDDWWKPGANTIAYYPFTSDALDQTWNTTLSSSWTADTIWRRFTTNTTISSAWSTKFISYWFKINSYSSSGWQWVVQTWFIQSLWELSYTLSQASAFSSIVGTISAFKNSWYTSYDYKYVWIDTTQRHHIAYWYDWTNLIWYYDWVKYTIWSSYYNFWSDVTLLRLINKSWDVTFSDLILETQTWTQDEITKYYNNTKSNYWRS
jgi:hypothetical protein